MCIISLWRGLLVLFAMVVLCTPSFAEIPMNKRVVTLEGVVGSATYKSAGLYKLKEKEQRILREWIESYGRQTAESVEEDCLAGRIKPNAPPEPDTQFKK